jgi:two-component system, OmpR family, sensor histidine kinase TctE
MMAHSASLFSRLVSRVAVVLGAGAAVLITAAWFYARTAADDAYDRLLIGAALQMAENLAVANGRLSFELPPSAFELLGLADRDRIFYRIVAPDGRTLTGYSDLGPNIDLSRSRTRPVLSNESYRNVAVRIVTVSRPVTETGRSGYAYVMVAQTTEARQLLVSELIGRATVLVAIMSALALLGTVLAVRYSLRPVAELGRALRNRDPRDLTPLAVAVPREMSPFVGSINHFIRRLDERVKLLQRYVADSAHQIRTPLTALSAQVSMIDESSLPPDDQRHLERVRNRTAELARLTNQLLNHAMVIHRFDSVQLVPLSLNEVARAAFRAAVPMTVDPDLIVSFEPSEDEPLVMGDVVSLREAIVNVVDNALRHGARTRLDVRVEIHGRTCAVVVEDDGPGIPRNEWDKVVERFFTTRSDGKTSGLGFAIASEVATALGGRIVFDEKREERLFAVGLELPLYGGDSE